MKEGRLPEPFQGKARYWIWEFDAERERVFEKENDPVGLLIDDMHRVPIVTALTETAEIRPPAFQTKGDAVNTIIEII
jgi:hypothetical protein